MTEKPELKNWITTGNLLQIGVWLIITGVLYSNHENRLAVLETGIADHEVRIRYKEQTDSVNAKEIAVELTKINARLTGIEKAVKP